MNDRITNKVEERGDSILFIASSLDVTSGGQKKVAQQGCLLVIRIIAFLLFLTVSVGYFYISYTGGTLAFNPFTIFMIVIFCMSMLLLYLFLSGNKGSVYHHEIEINRVTERVIIRDAINHYDYSISFGEFAAYKISTRKVPGKNTFYENVIYLLLDSGVELWLYTKVSTHFDHHFDRGFIEKIKSYLHLPIIYVSKYANVNFTTSDSKAYDLEKRAFNIVEKPAFSIFSEEGIDGIKFKVKRTLEYKIGVGFAILFIASIIVIIFSDGIQFSVGESFTQTLVLNVVKMFSFAAILLFAFILFAVIYYHASSAQIAITSDEVVVYKKWHLPFLKKRFNKIHKLERNKIRGVEIGRNSLGKLSLWLLVKTNFPAHRFNFGVQSLGPPDLVNLKLATSLKGISIWQVGIQENLERSKLADLVAAWQFFRLSLIEPEVK